MKILVLTSDWQAGGYYVRYFEDRLCLDFSSLWRTLRPRLAHPVDAGTLTNCETGASFKVTRCTIV
jgi:hypothetical protein